MGFTGAPFANAAEAIGWGFEPFGVTISFPALGYILSVGVCMGSYALGRFGLSGMVGSVWASFRGGWASRRPLGPSDMEASFAADEDGPAILKERVSFL